VKVCSIPDCDKQAYARDWCKRHYDNWNRWGEPVRPARAPAKGQICSVDGCAEPVECRGYCRRHYGAWYRHGDPLTLILEPKDPANAGCIKCGDRLIVGANWPEWAPGQHYYVCYRCRAESTRAATRRWRSGGIGATYAQKWRDEHPLYSIWTGMLGRCLNLNSKSYPNYGGRGITVCERWIGPGGVRSREGYANFTADMGPRPEGTSLERLDNNGNYEPGNCCWADKNQQARNKRPMIRNAAHAELLRENERLRVMLASQNQVIGPQ
jgi:hypothetical protein